MCTGVDVAVAPSPTVAYLPAALRKADANHSSLSFSTGAKKAIMGVYC